MERARGGAASTGVTPDAPTPAPPHKGEGSDVPHAAVRRRCESAMSAAEKLSIEARSKKFGAAEEDGIVRCDACPVLCRIRPGRAGACSRYANEDGQLVRVDPVVVLEARRWTRAARWWSSPAASGTASCSIPRAPS